MIPQHAKILEVERGRWVADTTTSELPTGAFELGERTWSGTVKASALDGTSYKARIVGGTGGIDKKVSAKQYAASVSYAAIIADILRACGEKPGTIDASARAARYERAECTGGQALTALCDAAGLIWWVSRDGLVNVAKTRPALTAVDAQKTPQVGADVDGSVLLNVVNADDIQPGMTSDGVTLRALYWSLSSAALIAQCSPFQPVLPDSRPAEFYRKVYSAKVDSQNADGTVNVICDGAFELSRVPLLAGLPGVAVAVKPGELVAVGFFGFNAATPYAQGFAQLLSAAAALALVGDVCTMLLPPFALTGTALIGGVPTAITGVMTALTGQTLGTITGPGSGRTKSQ